MKIAYFDTVGGIAGDMTMAAFVSAGLPLEELSAALKALPLDGFELVGRHVRRSAIDAVHIEVIVSLEPHFHRDLHGIFSIIDQSTLPASVKETAKKVFRVIAIAEAKIHNVDPEKVHFHEVGAIDSIIDIVGTAICLEKFGIERVYSSPVRLGNGSTLTTRHGIIPNPSPATLEILKDYPVQLTDIPYELTTPTGAAIIKALSYGILRDEDLRVKAIGYGAGTKEIAEIPNFLRLLIGDLPDEILREDIVVVETNIDDMNPQVYPFLIEELLSAGAHDAYLIPIIMKKGRPGILLSVMVEKSRLETITELIYRHTTTIGLRIQQIGRRKLPRQYFEIDTSLGRTKAKLVVRNGKELVVPEFEECKRIARQTGRPLPEIMRQLEQELSTLKRDPS
jgi:uncharacterized protein (TIGR00299 family) protein